MGNVDRTAPDLLTTAEARAVLGMSTSAISRAVKAGELKIATKAPGLRGALFFDRAYIEALAAERGVKKAAS